MQRGSFRLALPGRGTAAPLHGVRKYVMRNTWWHQKPLPAARIHKLNMKVLA
jgi:hypothetical protein